MSRNGLIYAAKKRSTLLERDMGSCKSRVCCLDVILRWLTERLNPQGKTAGQQSVAFCVKHKLRSTLSCIMMEEKRGLFCFKVSI